jgi:hypothetical protein
MSTTSRFFGEPDHMPGKRLVANPGTVGEALSFILLFPDQYRPSELGLTKALREHPLCSNEARVEIDPHCAAKGTPLGLAGWGDHVMQLIGFDAPMPPQDLAHSLQVSHCDQALKAQARRHRSHMLLRYAGYTDDPLAQYNALAALAGIFAEAGALMVVNLRASSCIPASMLSPSQNPKLEHLISSFLPSLLYCGFVKYFIESSPGGWVRTVGADAVHLPDLAAYLPHMDQAEYYLRLYSDIHRYIRETESPIQAGDTMQVGPNEHIRLRPPKDEEYFLASDGVMLVVEPLSELEGRRAALQRH